MRDHKDVIHSSFRRKSIYIIYKNIIEKIIETRLYFYVIEIC